jgi:hypothetical protein
MKYLRQLPTVLGILLFNLLPLLIFGVVMFFFDYVGKQVMTSEQIRDYAESISDHVRYALSIHAEVFYVTVKDRNYLSGRETERTLCGAGSPKMYWAAYKPMDGNVYRCNTEAFALWLDKKFPRWREEGF